MGIDADMQHYVLTCATDRPWVRRLYAAAGGGSRDQTTGPTPKAAAGCAAAAPIFLAGVVERSVRCVRLNRTQEVGGPSPPSSTTGRLRVAGLSSCLRCGAYVRRSATAFIASPQLKLCRGSSNCGIAFDVDTFYGVHA
jgi:hypothetical protein